MTTRTDAAEPQPAQPVRPVRIVAGEQAGHNLRGLEILVVAALVVLIGAGAAVAGANAKDATDAGTPAAGATEVVADIPGHFGSLTHAPRTVAFTAGGQPAPAAGLGTE